MFKTRTFQKKLIFLGIKYFSFISGMAAFMVATMSLESKGHASVFISAVSFTLGIACGDTNTLTFYQTILKEKGSFDKGYYLVPRLILSTATALIVVLLFSDIVFNYFLIGLLISLFLPQGRVSGVESFGGVVIVGGLFKTTVSLYIFSYEYYIMPAEYLVCAAISSNYIASAPFHIVVGNSINSKSRGLSIVESLAILLKSFVLTLPIQLYTSLAPFFYMQIKGPGDIATYYLYERFIRGLGATVIGIQSGTTSKVSLIISKLHNIDSIRRLMQYSIYYSMCGIFVGVVFVLTAPYIFEIIKIDNSLFDNPMIWLFALTTSSMYVSNYIGVQVFMTMGKMAFVILSSIFAAIVFVVTLFLTDNQLLIVAAPEIAIAIFQTGVFYAFLFKNKRTN